MPGDEKIKRMRLALAFGFVYATCVIVGSASIGGSALSTGMGYAVFFGSFFVLVSYPLLLLFQRGLVYLIRRLTRRPETGPALWGYTPVILLSLLFLGGATPRSPEAYFRQYVTEDVPGSVSEIRYWYARGFGNSQWAVTFRIAPEDFDAVLVKYPFTEKRLEEGYEPWLPEAVAGDLEEPLVYHYSYSEPGPGGGLNVNLYANSKKSLVYLVGSYD